MCPPPRTYGYQMLYKIPNIDKENTKHWRQPLRPLGAREYIYIYRQYRLPKLRLFKGLRVKVCVPLPPPPLWRYFCSEICQAGEGGGISRY